MQILRKTLFCERCVFQSSHWCDSFPQEKKKTRSLPYLLNYFPSSQPPSPLFFLILKFGEEKSNQISSSPCNLSSRTSSSLIVPCFDSNRDLEERLLSDTATL